MNIGPDRPLIRAVCASLLASTVFCSLMAKTTAADEPDTHWAFQPPVRPQPPAVKDGTVVVNALDLFLQAARERSGVAPLPLSPKHLLLRRLYLDLSGVPPTRHQLRSFLNDRSPNAYEKVVDRLLQESSYGERWGRHWMDVWRYSDWYGRRGVPDVLNSYAQIWRWRDWIVRSLNEDKGYDRMVMEMLAADELYPKDDESIVATGFLVRNFYRWNYNTWMKDSVEHTAKAFLGITLNCCHCHDHKYDPFTHEEYFRFRAFFEPIEIRHDRVPGEPDPGPYPKYSYGKAYKPITSGAVRIMDEKLDAETFMYTGGESRNVIAGRPPVAPGVPAALGGGDLNIEPVELPATSWYPGLKPFVRDEAVAKASQELARMKQVLGRARQLVSEAKDDTAREMAELTLLVDRANVARAKAALEAIRARIDADRMRYQHQPGDPEAAARKASKAQRQSALDTTRVELARANRDLVAAQRKQPMDEKAQTAVRQAEQKVAAAREATSKAEQALASESADYDPFGPMYPKTSTGRRSALARWIVHRSNPLTARVAINHIWRGHFGRPLVETTENFGRSGTEPSHPGLLDWLATELMENQWRMKHIHRLIVTSHTYRLASAVPTADNRTAQLDPDNIQLWKFRTNRMGAEMVRNSVLHVAASLQRSLGGKEIAQNLGLTVPRRSIYFEHHGEGRMELLDLFDAADPCDCYRRSTSVRPQQALALVNSELTIFQSRLLARRLLEELGPEVASNRKAFVAAAFEQILSRPPTPGEKAASAQFLHRQIGFFESVDLAAAKQTDAVPASIDPVTRAYENLIQALFSHNDFVTIR